MDSPSFCPPGPTSAFSLQPTAAPPRQLPAHRATGDRHGLFPGHVGGFLHQPTWAQGLPIGLAEPFLELCCNAKLFLPQFPYVLSSLPGWHGLKPLPLLPLPPPYAPQVFPPINTLYLESHCGVCFSEDVDSHRDDAEAQPVEPLPTLPFLSLPPLFLSSKIGIFKGHDCPGLRFSKATEKDHSQDKKHKVQEPPQTRLESRTDTRLFRNSCDLGASPERKMLTFLRFSAPSALHSISLDPPECPEGQHYDPYFTGEDTGLRDGKPLA